jgi:gas vesicle protein
MSEENPKKKSRLFDKIMMGAIIGGAIGSVVGASVSGKKEQEEAKEEVAKELTKAKESSKTILRKFLGIFRKKEENGTKKIPNELEEYKK